ncbi:Acg family FMN-binding oxidoreductase [Prauserella oleivorans]|uniref:Acg family FMN-binding oxidoreductase n=1 Tax=Prauserella oleivorans TaxID=1478153 RepID=A0ABW5WDA5_9PSEU
MTDTTTPPLTGLLHAALLAAVRAPSPHNTQPWEFRVGTGRIDVLLDETRILGVCDPGAREATLACGAALLNIRLVLAARGHASEVRIQPDPARPRLLARVHVGGPHRPAPDELRLATAIGHRHTNRRPFLDRPVPTAVRHTLVMAAHAEGGQLLLLEQPPRLAALAALLRRADAVQARDEGFQEEVRAWTRTGRRPDGVPATAGGPRATPGEPLLARPDDTVPEGPGGSGLRRGPLVAVLTTPGDTRRDVIRAGQAMQRVLLAATAAGLGASFLSPLVEVSSARAVLHAMLGDRHHPQTVFRLGYGCPVSITRRRPVEDVTMQEWPYDQ